VHEKLLGPKNRRNFLKKDVRKHRGGKNDNCFIGVVNRESQASDSFLVSLNNDWKHWVVIHGKEEVVVDDVRGIGKAIGVKFNGDKMNMFNLLSRVGREKKVL